MKENTNNNLLDLKYREELIKKKLKEYIKLKKYYEINKISFEYSSISLLPIFFNFFPRRKFMFDLIELLIIKYNHIVIMKFTDFNNYEKKFKNIIDSNKYKYSNKDQIIKFIKNRNLIKYLIKNNKKLNKKIRLKEPNIIIQHNYITIFISIREYFPMTEYLKSFKFQIKMIYFPFFKFLNKYFNRLISESLQCEWIRYIKSIYNCESGCYFDYIINSNNYLKYKSDIILIKINRLKISKLNNLKNCNCNNKIYNNNSINKLSIKLKKITLRPDFLLNSLLNFNEEIKKIKNTLPFSLKLTMSSMQQLSIAEGILKQGCFLYDELNQNNKKKYCYCPICVKKNYQTLPIPIKITVNDIETINYYGIYNNEKILFNWDDYSLFNFNNFNLINNVLIKKNKFNYETLFSDFLLIENIEDDDIEIPTINLINSLRKKYSILNFNYEYPYKNYDSILLNTFEYYYNSKKTIINKRKEIELLNKKFSNEFLNKKIKLIKKIKNNIYEPLTKEELNVDDYLFKTEEKNNKIIK